MRCSLLIPLLGLALSASASVSLAAVVGRNGGHTGIRRLAPDALLNSELATPFNAGDAVQSSASDIKQEGAAAPQLEIRDKDAECDGDPQTMVQYFQQSKAAISQQVAVIKSINSQDESAYVAPVQAIYSEMQVLLTQVQAYQAAGYSFSINDPAFGPGFSSLVGGLIGLLVEVLTVVKALGISLGLWPTLSALLNDVLALVGQLLLVVNGLVGGFLVLLSPVLKSLLGLVASLGLSGVLAGLLAKLGLGLL